MKGYYGPTIYHYRKLRKVSQQSLAEALGMSRQNLSDIERNKCQILVQRLAIVAQVLQVTVEDIRHFHAESDLALNADHGSGLHGQPNPALITMSATLLHMKSAFEAMQNSYGLFLKLQAERELLKQSLTMDAKNSQTRRFFEVSRTTSYISGWRHIKVI